jgi:hypothetical protein
MTYQKIFGCSSKRATDQTAGYPTVFIPQSIEGSDHFGDELRFWVG